MNPIKVDINDLDKYFVKSELTPAIAFDVDTKTVLMLAYMNKESLKKTLETGYTWYWSRSRQEYWNKGATSGHLQKVVSIYAGKSQENSYTAYLFDKGVDKICKKVGEEATETVIAAKNGDNDELKNEINDLLYHVMVLAANQGLEWSDVEKVLDERNEKIGNLKKFHQVDKNT